MPGSLENLAPGVYAWIDDDHGPGHPNAGLVVAEDGLTVIDSLCTPRQAAPLAAAVSNLIETPVRRVVFTGSHVEFVGGASAFPMAAIYGSGQTSAHLDQPGDPAVWTALHPEHRDDFVDLVTRPVSHVVQEPAYLCPASIAIPGGGFQLENLVVQVPGADVVFLGALGWFGSVPLGFEADFELWIETLHQALGWGSIFVPGHGPIGDSADVRTLIGYLEAVRAAADGDALRDGPWSQWSAPRHHEINIERAAMLASGDPAPPPSMMRLLGRH